MTKIKSIPIPEYYRKHSSPRRPAVATVWETLYRLNQEKDFPVFGIRISQKSLAREAGVREDTVVRVLNFLVSRGMIEKTPYKNTFRYRVTYKREVNILIKEKEQPYEN